MYQHKVLCSQVLPDDEMMADLYIMAVEVCCSTSCHLCLCSHLFLPLGAASFGGVSVIVAGRMATDGVGCVCLFPDSRGEWADEV